jgi:hypothetical protein
MRIAWWSPLPPQPTGVSGYSETVLERLRERMDIVGVVEDRVAGSVRAPEGVAVVGATAYRAGAGGRVDLNVYQMGNHFLHGYLHAPALELPGLLTLHDPSLVDFYRWACGGFDSTTFLDEARYNDPNVVDDLPMLVIDGRAEPDRLGLLMSRRLVEASIQTAVHSTWVRDELRCRWPGTPVVDSR